MNKAQHRLLSNLKSFLEKMPEKIKPHFDLREWAADDGADTRIFIAGNKLSKKEILTCGTQACAIGWGAMLPSWQRAGFGLVVNNCGTAGLPVFNDLSGWQAVCAFLGISESQANHLFSMFDYPKGKRGPKQVANRIGEFLKENRPEAD